MTSKDNIVKLTELSEGDLEFRETELNNASFKDVMGQMINNRKMKDDDKKDGK